MDLLLGGERGAGMLSKNETGEQKRLEVLESLPLLVSALQWDLS